MSKRRGSTRARWKPGDGSKRSKTADLAAVQEMLGDSWHRAGDFHKAAEVFVASRRLAADNRLKASQLLLKRSWMEEKLGQYRNAMRWAAKARRAIDGLTGRGAAQQTAQLSAWYATLLQSEGRSQEAIRWARKGIAEAEAIDDADALASAYFAMGWASSDLGRESALPMWKRSLEAFQRSGNRVRYAGLLSNLGVACQWEGQWDEALSYYQSAREETLKIGSTTDAEVARINIAEILTDRGELAEAEKLLLDSLPVWRALGYRYFQGACLALLGRVLLRAARFDEAVGRFDEARSHFDHAGSQQDILDVDARIAECRAFMHDPVAALELAERTLARAGTANAKLVALLERVRGYARYQRDDAAGARQALDVSLAAGRTRRDPFEVAQTLHALIELDRVSGVQPKPEIAAESRSLLATLKVPALPPAPFDPH